MINEADYVEFDNNSSYLAAKLMTIFMEYPIIFLGYSLSDYNIQTIIKSIVHVLNKKQLKTLKNRFVFIEYNSQINKYDISSATIMVDDYALEMIKIQLSDFSYLYNALNGKKSKLPVRLLRRFKEELYQYTITNLPTSNLRVASIDDERISDEDMVLAIGRAKALGLKGLSGISTDEWYRDVVIGDLDFSADDLLKYAYPKLIKQNTILPVNKYLSQATEEYKEAQDLSHKYKFDDLISNSIKKSRKTLKNYKSVFDIWDGERQNLERATRLIAYLEEDMIDINELEFVLKELFNQDIYILQNSKQQIKTNIRRLIRIYDYLKYGKDK